MGDKTVKRIIFFASGSGTNVENIIKYFHCNKSVEITLILTNNPNAGIVRRAEKLKKPLMLFSKRELLDQSLLKKIVKINPDLIILAGFLLKIPKEFVKAFPKKIINIHPALLPNYGGKGMYGINVHKAVKMNNEKKSGITIHYVDNGYDTGKIIFQKEVKISKLDSVEDISNKVHNLELEHFPRVIELILFKV